MPAYTFNSIGSVPPGSLSRKGISSTPISGNTMTATRNQRAIAVAGSSWKRGSSVRAGTPAMSVRSDPGGDIGDQARVDVPGHRVLAQVAVALAGDAEMVERGVQLELDLRVVVEAGLPALPVGVDDLDVARALQHQHRQVRELRLVHRVHGVGTAPVGGRQVQRQARCRQLLAGA